MFFQVKVRVDVSKMREFGGALQRDELDRGCIRGDTHCLRDDPAVGFSIWEASSREEFESRFSGWRPFYLSVEVAEVVAPQEAMGLLVAQLAR